MTLRFVVSAAATDLELTRLHKPEPSTQATAPAVPVGGTNGKKDRKKKPAKAQVSASTPQQGRVQLT
jgi:hypothetical protein